MRRLVRLVVATLAAFVPAAALAAAPSPPRAALTGVLCQRALDPAARVVSVTAVMRPVEGTERMQVEFRLLQRLAGARRYLSLGGVGLDTWLEPPVPTLGQRPADVWRVIKPVSDLAAPAVYRFAVAFRWLGGGGHVLKMLTRSSRTCRQVERRADLVVAATTVTADQGHPSLDAYRVRVVNRGATGARHVTVRFTQAGRSEDKTIRYVRAHQRQDVTFPGALCDPSDPPYVTVDPDQQIDVYTRAQSTRVFSCPSPDRRSRTLSSRVR
jgi:hypothetical protein